MDESLPVLTTFLLHSSRMRSSKPRRATTEARHAPPRRPAKRISTVKHVKAAELAAEPAPALENVPFFQQGILSHAQKRELILAHAKARQVRNTPNSWFYLMGVAASCLVVIGGWWLTVGSWVRSQMTLVARPAIQEDIRREMERLEAKYPFPKPNFVDAKAALTQGASAIGEMTATTTVRAE